ncbi:MAG: hypothetical protein KKE62_06060 [Proteobacteria bacterium]|nr:hypothetical protein [Pseudomonadota bacterium]MBU1542392.1 hypothetical protein [Pseudomonadota bacterium]MBU2481173.1 hypothetical protein [Pseudomonadota bacterium]
MGRVKDWLMEMEEDAHVISKNKFIEKHGNSNEILWNQINSHRSPNSFEYYEAEEGLIIPESSDGMGKPINIKFNYRDIPF